MTSLIFLHFLPGFKIDKSCVHKASGKILLGFCRGNQGDVNLRVGLQNMSSLLHCCIRAANILPFFMELIA